LLFVDCLGVGSNLFKPFVFDILYRVFIIILPLRYVFKIGARYTGSILSLISKIMMKNIIDPTQQQEETMSKGELEQYFTAIKANFNHIDERFDAVDRKFDAVDRRFDAVELRLNRIESIAFMILDIVKGNDAKLSNFESRLLRLEKHAI